MSDVVIDTNVPLVANEMHEDASLKCIVACIDELIETQKNRRVRIDQSGLILDEYRTYLSHSGQPGPGDAFFKWLWDNQAVLTHCLKVEIAQDDDDEFVAFPRDSDLSTFDPSDRKFVATALAVAPYARVLNASDTDWYEHRAVFDRHGLEISFICPDLME